MVLLDTDQLTMIMSRESSKRGNQIESSGKLGRKMPSQLNNQALKSGVMRDRKKLWNRKCWSMCEIFNVRMKDDCERERDFEIFVHASQTRYE